MGPIYIAYYTPAYAEEAAGLRSTLAQFGLPHDIVAVPDLGLWKANTQYKARFVREWMSCRLPLVYVDADARIRQRPVLFNSLDCDFAAYWHLDQELLSGTLYFGPTAVARTLVDAWIAECAAHPEILDQRCLQAVVPQIADLRAHRLPPAYCQIFDDMAYFGEPVIEHLQASRRFRERRK